MTDAERQLEVVKAELVNARRVIDLLREGWEVEPASRGQPAQSRSSWFGL